MRRQIILYLILLTLCAGSASAGLTSGARILTFPVSARALAMGEAFSPLADDLYALHFNPAGLNLLVNNQIGMTYITGLYDTYYTNLSVAMPVSPDVGLGASFTYLDGGQIDLIFTDGTEQRVNAQQDYLITLSGGTRVYGQNQVGLNLKILSSQLVESYQALTFALDAGLLYALSDDLNFAFVLKNVGPSIKYINESDPLPTTLEAGLAQVFHFSAQHQLNAALVLNKPLDLDYRVHTGVEYWYQDFIAIRAGYRYGHDLAGLTLGGGVELEWLRLDYALGFMGELGSNHYLSVLFKF